MADGIELKRMYAYIFCSPTRSAFISGRWPIHVNSLNTDPTNWNPQSGEGAGVATKMTGVAEHLKAGGYRTHAIGKVWWDIRSDLSLGL